MIVATPGTLGGKPRIAGRRIGVDHIAHWHHREGWDIAYIMEQFDLTEAEVRAALNYYAAHREEIDARTRADEARLAEYVR